jgi:hypothetical protein
MKALIADQEKISMESTSVHAGFKSKFAAFLPS